jgi:hypothetical protein
MVIEKIISVSIHDSQRSKALFDGGKALYSRRLPNMFETMFLKHFAYFGLLVSPVNGRNDKGAKA